jgi:type 1 glutamine amidotransferase
MNGGTSTTSAGTGNTTAGTGVVAGGTGNMAGTGSTPVGGSGGSGPMGGSSTGGSNAAAGSGPMAGSGGGGGEVAVGPYAPRTGSFKMLVYSKTGGYRHTDSINKGKVMLQQIATEQGFEVVMSETNEDIKFNPAAPTEGLGKYEIVFFMNSTGDIFNDAEQKAYEDWMTSEKGGAFAGVHSATDTEKGWAFYSDVTGQYYNGHGAVVPDTIVFEPAMVNHPALKGIQTPWQRNEEWYKFDNFQQWSAQEGFQILGRKTADGQPIMWTRQYANFRAFYTAIGHEGVVFEDPQVKKHLTGGLMWAVRRDHLIK